MSDLAAAAAAMGVPEALVKRSAEARARATGTSVDDILAAWAGGGASSGGCAARAVRGWRFEVRGSRTVGGRSSNRIRTSNLKPRASNHGRSSSSLERRDSDDHCSAAANRGFA